MYKTSYVVSVLYSYEVWLQPQYQDLFQYQNPFSASRFPFSYYFPCIFLILPEPLQISDNVCTKSESSIYLFHWYSSDDSSNIPVGTTKYPDLLNHNACQRQRASVCERHPMILPWNCQLRPYYLVESFFLQVVLYQLQEMSKGRAGLLPSDVLSRKLYVALLAWKGRARLLTMSSRRRVVVFLRCVRLFATAFGACVWATSVTLLFVIRLS